MIGRDLSYHGTTLGTLAVGGHAKRRAGLEPAARRLAEGAGLLLPALPARPGATGLRRRVRRRDRGPDRTRGPRDDRGGRRRAGRRLDGGRAGAARRVLAAPRRDLPSPRCVADRRRGDDRLRPHRPQLRRRSLGRRRPTSSSAARDSPAAMRRWAASTRPTRCSRRSPQRGEEFMFYTYGGASGVVRRGARGADDRRARGARRARGRTGQAAARSAARRARRSPPRRRSARPRPAARRRTGARPRDARALPGAVKFTNRVVAQASATACSSIPAVRAPRATSSAWARPSRSATRRSNDRDRAAEGDRRRGVRRSR